MKTKYSVRFYLKGVSPTAKIWCPKQIEYKRDSLSSAVRAGFNYLRTQDVIVTSYTVTDRTTGEKTNIKLG